MNDPEDDCCGEIEVMIAEPRARLKGCATEALKLLMGYCYDTIRISKFVAKIGKHNLKSYSLFKNKVGSLVCFPYTEYTFRTLSIIYEHF